MDPIIDIDKILSSHLFWGLVIGLIIWFLACVRHFFRVKALKKDFNTRLKSITIEKNRYMQHLQTQLEIDAESKETQKKTIERLKDETENLRTMIHFLKQEPKKEEIIMLQVYDKAIHMMHERAPGFAPTWETTLREAQLEFEKMQKGFMPFLKRIIRPSSHYNLNKSLNTKKLGYDPDFKKSEE